MSSDQMTEKAKQTLKSLKELLEKAEDSTQRALEKAAPALQKSIDTSMGAAANGFNASMKSIDGATVGDQIKILKAYRKFLSGQVEFVETRIRALEEKASSADSARQ